MMIGNEDGDDNCPEDEALYFKMPDSATLQIRLSSINLKLIAYCEAAIGELDPKSKSDRAWVLDAMSLLGDCNYDPQVVIEEEIE